MDGGLLRDHQQRRKTHGYALVACLGLKSYIQPSPCCAVTVRPETCWKCVQDGTVSTGDRCIHTASGRDAEANALPAAIAAAAASASAQFDQIGVG